MVTWPYLRAALHGSRSSTTTCGRDVAGCDWIAAARARPAMPPPATTTTSPVPRRFSVGAGVAEGIAFALSVAAVEGAFAFAFAFATWTLSVVGVAAAVASGDDAPGHWVSASHIARSTEGRFSLTGCETRRRSESVGGAHASRPRFCHVRRHCQHYQEIEPARAKVHKAQQKTKQKLYRCSSSAQRGSEVGQLLRVPRFAPPLVHISKVSQRRRRGQRRGGEEGSFFKTRGGGGLKTRGSLSPHAQLRTHARSPTQTNSSGDHTNSKARVERD